MTAYCGIDCSKCKAFRASQTNNTEEKERIAKHWSNQGEVKFASVEVDCRGCKSDVISGFCRKLCAVRPCAIERKVASCAQCDDYLCGKLAEYLSTDPDTTKNLENIRKRIGKT